MARVLQSKKKKVKHKDLLSFWITNYIKMSSKCKKRWYDKFIKNRNKTYFMLCYVTGNIHWFVSYLENDK